MIDLWLHSRAAVARDALIIPLFEALSWVPTKTINLSQTDLESVQRLLTGLAEGGSGGQDADSEAMQRRLVNIARASLSVRRRRSDFLHRAMLGEPAYDMLLGLYVAEAEGELLTAARLADTAGVAPSSALRWIDYLAAKELVVREPHPTRKRASVLKLSCKGRAALEGIFRSILDGIQEVVI
jgi:DNA-binding MarR family transcriptional regulator